jgi:hypothetical protein
MTITNNERESILSLLEVDVFTIVGKIELEGRVFLNVLPEDFDQTAVIRIGDNEIVEWDFDWDDLIEEYL